MKNAKSDTFCAAADSIVGRTQFADSGSLSDSISNDGIDRRSFLSCLAWVGTGLLWTMTGGVPTPKLFVATSGPRGAEAAHAGSSFSFVQISDSQIGFNKGANQDVTGTLKLALDKISSLSKQPDLFCTPKAFLICRKSQNSTRCNNLSSVPPGATSLL